MSRPYFPKRLRRRQPGAHRRPPHPSRRRGHGVDALYGVLDNPVARGRWVLTQGTGGVGLDHIIEVAGPKSMEQSLKAVKVSGLITIVGFVGGQDTKDQPGFLECLHNLCTTRGILVRSRQQMEDMCLAVEGNPETPRPVVDKRLFELEQLKEAYEYQWSGQRFGKVCVTIAQLYVWLLMWPCSSTERGRAVGAGQKCFVEEQYMGV
ncbi:hypothetical protein J3458_006866 [Metarhizium acridum]|uniref:uncharacterized protein n=1 Tax=Metarhizium acridum TaxID=92637 RepID=UPI001C6AC8BF|nr:hypothetical protein J3458_006866 [Metarhizium acridum]